MKTLIAVFLLILLVPSDAFAEPKQLRETIQRVLPRVISALKLYRPEYAELSDAAIHHKVVCEEASRYLGVLLRKSGFVVTLVYGKGHYYLRTAATTPFESDYVIDLTYRQFLRTPGLGDNEAQVAWFEERQVPEYLLVPEAELPLVLSKLSTRLGLSPAQQQTLEWAMSSTLSSVSELRTTEALVDLNNAHFRLGERGLYDNQYAVLEGLSEGAVGVSRAYLVQTPKGKWKSLYMNGFDDLHSLAINTRSFIRGLAGLSPIPSGRAGIFLDTRFYDGFFDRILYAPDYVSSPYVHTFYATLEELRAQGIELSLDPEVVQAPLGPLAMALEFAAPHLLERPRGKISITLGPGGEGSYDLSPHLRGDDCNRSYQSLH